MLKRTSNDFREQFLIRFTEELIRGTDSYQKIFIKKEVKEIEKENKGTPKETTIIPKKEIKEIVHEKIQKDSENLSRIKQEEEVFGEFKPRLPERRIVPPLRIPEYMLPETVSHFKPVPTREQINLEKLNPLIRDPLVKVIECNGPDEPIVVMGAMGRKPTSLSLRKEQIEEIIQKFSEETRIPVSEGIYKAVHGNLIISAIISEIIGSKFIIRKMS